MPIEYDEDIQYSEEKLRKAREELNNLYKQLFSPKESTRTTISNLLLKNSVINVEGMSTLPLEHKPTLINSTYKYEYRGKRIKHKLKARF
jgi:hypothetical protein